MKEVELGVKYLFFEMTNESKEWAGIYESHEKMKLGLYSKRLSLDLGFVSI